MPYEFSDLGDLSCAEIVRQFKELLLTRIAVNTSYDSGQLSRPDWRTVNGFCVSPPIETTLLDAWPVSHDDCWDEWWVFDNRVPQDFHVKAFCNFGLPISRYKELDFEDGCRIDHYLGLFRPAVVFGNNQTSAYLIRPGKQESAE